MLQVRIDHRSFGRFPHDGAALQMTRLVHAGVVGSHAARWREVRHAHRSYNLNGFGNSKIRHAALVLTPVERHTKKWISIPICIRRIEVHKIASVGQVFALKGESPRAIIVVNCRFFPRRTPLRLDRFRNGAKRAERTVTVARGLQRTAAYKRELRVIKDMTAEVADQNAGRSRSHELVQRLFKKSEHR